MHQYAIEHGGYRAYWQLHWRRHDTGTTMLFYIQGPVDPYRAALAEYAPDATHSVAEAAGDGLYLYVHTQLQGSDRGLAAAVDRPGVLLVPPVEYRMDGSVVASLVGPSPELTATVEGIPAPFDPEVLAITPHPERYLEPASALTDRQRAVLTEAVDAGYYEEPREASVEEVAAATDCAPSTAAEHLRKAEAALVERATGGPSAGRGAVAAAGDAATGPRR